MSIELLPAFVREHYEVHEWKHACAILKEDFPQEWRDILAVLQDFRLRKSWVTMPGGRKSRVSGFIDQYLYDRDLNNFRLLFDLRAISVGVIITRCDDLQEIFNALGRGSSYGASTTHMSKLLPRIEGGGGAGCPILVFGISSRLYDNEE